MMRVISFSHSHCLLDSPFMKRNARLTYGLFSLHWPPCDLILLCVASFIIDSLWFLGEALAYLYRVSHLILFTYLYILESFNNSRFLFGLQIFFSVNYPPLPIPILYSIILSPSQLNFLVWLFPVYISSGFYFHSPKSTPHLGPFLIYWLLWALKCKKHTSKFQNQHPYMTENFQYLFFWVWITTFIMDFSNVRLIWTS